MTLVDPTGYLLTTIRDNAGVAALTDRVRIGRPQPGDGLTVGQWRRFIVLVRLGRTRLPHAPVQEVRYVAQCYGQGGNPEQDADQLAGAVSDAIHNAGHRISSGGVSVFGSYEDGGEGPTYDPVTGQPHSDVVIALGALTSLVP